MLLHFLLFRLSQLFRLELELVNQPVNNKPFLDVIFNPKAFNFRKLQQSQRRQLVQNFNTLIVILCSHVKCQSLVDGKYPALHNSIL